MVMILCVSVPPILVLQS